MSNKVLLKKSSVGAKVPLTSDLDYGEVALNYADGKLYFKNSSNTIQPLGIAYTKVIADVTAKINQGYIANTGAGSFTITLPANPQTGNYVIIVDDGNFNTNPLYVARNAQPIVGTAQDLTLDIQGVSVTLLYDGGQWNVYTQVGASGGSGSGVESQEYNFNSLPTNLIPDTNNTYQLGNATYGWKSLYFADGTVQSKAAVADGTSITNSGGTITAQAGGLSGSVLNSTVINSSLTSVGTILSGTWQGTPIANAYLANSSFYVGTTNISLGRASLAQTLSGVSISGNAGTVTNGVYTTDTGTVTNTMLAGSIANAKLANSSVTVGTTAISLGSSSTTLAGLTSVTSTSFVGALSGNASTATTLATPRAINGVNFDGSAAITVTAAAGTLTGTTLNSTVVSSSLTSVGTLTSLTTSGKITSTVVAGAEFLDASSNNATYANNATVDFPNFSGMIIVNNTGSTGQVMMVLCGGGSVGVLGYSGTGLPHKTGTITSVAGINGYRWTNDSGASDTFSFAAIKTRASA